MNTLALYHAPAGLLLGLVLFLILFLPFWPYSRSFTPWPSAGFGLILLVLLILLLIGCTKDQKLTPQQSAAAQTASNLAHIAAEAAATYYGGPAAGVLASAGLDAGAAVLQGYVGTTVPPEILKASPGVAGIGPILLQQFGANHVVSQADVNRINQAAAIAATLKPALIAPSASA